MRTYWRAAAALCLCLAAPQAGASPTLYQNLGGQAGVRAITANAVGLYMTDQRLSSYFNDINPDHLRSRFADYICKIADGPCIYRGRSMAASHKGLHVNQAAFNAVVEDLQIAMDRAGIGFGTQNHLLARLAPMERDIVTR